MLQLRGRGSAGVRLGSTAAVPPPESGAGAWRRARPAGRRAGVQPVGISETTGLRSSRKMPATARIAVTAGSRSAPLKKCAAGPARGKSISLFSLALSPLGHPICRVLLPEAPRPASSARQPPAPAPPGSSAPRMLLKYPFIGLRLPAQLLVLLCGRGRKSPAGPSGCAPAAQSQLPSGPPRPIRCCWRCRCAPPRC